MHVRARKIADFCQNYVKTPRAKQSASIPVATNADRGTPQPSQAVHLPVPRWMLGEQAYIREFGYSH